MNRVRYNARWAWHNTGVFLLACRRWLRQPARTKPPTRADVIVEFMWLFILILIAGNAGRQGRLAWVLAGCVITGVLGIACTIRKRPPSA